MFERFTEDARAVVVAAQREAVGLHHGWIGAEHLLLGLMDDPGSRAARLLAACEITPAWTRAEIERIAGRGEPDIDAAALATLGIDLDAVRERVERAFGPGALAGRGRCRRRAPGGSALPFTPGAKKALELALRETVAMRDDAIGSEHVLLGILRADDGVAAAVLGGRGVTAAAVRADLQRDGAR